MVEIKSKSDLKYFLTEDLKRYDKKPTIVDWFLKNEVWYIYHFVRNLRYLEFYQNKQRNILSSLPRLYHLIIYKRQVYNLKVDIKPGNLGPGFRLFHLGSLVRIKKNCRIGKNCTMQPGVVIGNKYISDDGSFVIIGDNCFIGLDVKILGNVVIGNNVIIGANSVVVKDIPDNCIVGGVPARVIGERAI